MKTTDLQKKNIALTGASGNMGVATLSAFMASDAVDKVRVLLLDKPRERRYAKVWKRKYGDRIQILFGDLFNEEDCVKLVHGVDYVFNLAAVIPPTSDKYPELARRCNVFGVKNLVSAIEAEKPQPKFVHISSVAVYGNRNYLHPWGRVGDPLMPSVYDDYALTKTIGERFVLDSDIETWAVLRQTAMLHSRMLTDNISDGLMFHTCFNAPLEWVTAGDSGRLMARIVERDAKREVDNFWKKVYNIGGGAANRKTGFETFDDGFKIIGGSAESFLEPDWNGIRNFHGMWFADSDVLEDMFSFRKETFSDYWDEILRTHPYYKVGALLPPIVLKTLVFKPLLSNYNSPVKWLRDENNGKVKAYFGSPENAKCLPKTWDSFPLLCRNSVDTGKVDYDKLRDGANLKERGLLLDHGYDEAKPDSELDITDMRKAAAFRGGKCLSKTMKKGDLYTRLLWECGDGHRFYLSPYAVLKAGHWCDKCLTEGKWDYDRQAKYNKFYAEIWYDSHAKNENRVYSYDAGHRAVCSKFMEA